MTKTEHSTTPEQNFTFVSDSTDLAETGQEIVLPLIAGFAIILVGVGVSYRVNR